MPKEDPSVELASLVANVDSLASESEDRQELIARLKREVSSGEYHVNSDELAGKLMDSISRKPRRRKI